MLHSFVTVGHTLAATAAGTIVGLIVGVIWSPRAKTLIAAEEQKLASGVQGAVKKL
jgi:hypothetical protein